ncbi:MAG TPA: glycosyl hydrolase family 28-related protein, partial [Holophagaceae bacterium]|nr:glycosyl hydrolase family 28-related protein [Holophagaceae bacterium]
MVPAAATLDPGTSQSITATVSGGPSADLVWTVDNILNGDNTVGTLSGSGGTVTYTAPTSEGTHLVIAAPKTGGTASGSATIRVQSSTVGVSLTPSTVTLKAGGTQSFTSGISGTTNTAVWWTVDGITGGNATVGTVSGTGLTVTYTAPTTVPATTAHTLTVHSKADTSKGDSATITVTASAPPPPPPAPVSVSLTPALVSLAPGATQSFTAAVAGSTNTAVTWKVDGLSGGSASAGTISGSGSTVTYTAPATAGSHSLTVTSVADTTKSASATATINATCAPAPTSSTTVSVKDAAYGAKGDGVTDDTAAIQKAVNAIGGTGGTVTVPDGTYMVNALTSINLQSNMTFALSSGATLKAITNSASNY